MSHGMAINPPAELEDLEKCVQVPCARPRCVKSPPVAITRIVRDLMWRGRVAGL